MKVLVTGANSLLGTHLLHELLQTNYEVKAMVRDKNKLLISHPRLEIVEADLREKNKLLQVVKDVDTIIHNAAITSQKYNKYKKYYEVNVEGTKNLLKASLQQKVRKIIYISTANTFYKNHQLKEKKNALVEETHYAKSKMEAEEILFAIASPIKICLVHPTFMIGKYDTKPSSGKIIKWMYGNKIVFYPPGGKNFVSANKVSQWAVKLIRVGKNKTSYLIAGTNLSYKEFFKKAIKATGQKSILVKLPSIFLFIIGMLSEVAQSLHIKTNISLLHMKILCTKTFYHSKNIPEGWKRAYPTCFLKELQQAIQWMEKHKII